MSVFSMRRTAIFAAGGLQIGCAISIFLDIVAEWHGVTASSVLEMLTLVALGIGTFLALREFKMLNKRKMIIEREFSVARGEFQAVIYEHFNAWGLTAAEKDVALLAIKGASIADIARMRDTKNGTIKAQNAAIYRKAGVSSRAELISVVIEEMISGLVPPSLADEDGKSPAMRT